MEKLGEAISKNGVEMSNTKHIEGDSLTIKNNMKVCMPSPLFSSFFFMPDEEVFPPACTFKGQYLKVFWKSYIDGLFLLDPSVTVRSYKITGIRGNFDYTKTSDMELFRLKIGKDQSQLSTHSLVLINPLDVDGLTNIEKKINLNNFSGWLYGAKEKYCSLAFYSFLFRGVFCSFFSNIHESGFTINYEIKGIKAPRTHFKELIHNTAFYIHMWPLRGIHSFVSRDFPFPVCKFDHPFLYFIIDDLTNTILIMGRDISVSGIWPEVSIFDLLPQAIMNVLK
jgi:serine protease inhibitor